jgi:cytochrome b6-f complex iron-sulfur subunit
VGGNDRSRRGFLAALSAGLGLAASYGLLAGYALAYLFPPPSRRKPARLFVGRRSDFPDGSVKPIVDQRGRTVLVLARATGLEAFDTRCPHLGCRVHWEAEHQQFVCPCHQGIFDADGKAIAGPPADAGQSLTRVPLDVDRASGTVFLSEEA